MKNKSYCRVLSLLAVALTIATLSLFASPATLCYAQGGYGVPPAEEEPDLPPSFTSVSEVVDYRGLFTTNITVESDDEVIQLTIDEGTKALSKFGEPLSGIIIKDVADPPDPPADEALVGLVYELGPAGTTFDPPITLTFNYDQSDIPQGISETDLVLTIWDEDAGEWVELEDYTVDPETNTISAAISHFSMYAILAIPTPPTPAAPPPSPAAFSLSDLTIQPLEVQPEETVEITVTLTNTGDVEGSYTIILDIDGLKEKEKIAFLAGKKSVIAAFSVSREKPGDYNVAVGELSSSFSVAAPAAEGEVVPPEKEEEVIVPPEKEEEVPEVSAPIAWWIWVIAGVLIVAVIAVIWRIRIGI